MVTEQQIYWVLYKEGKYLRLDWGIADTIDDVEFVDGYVEALITEADKLTLSTRNVDFAEQYKCIWKKVVCTTTSIIET